MRQCHDVPARRRVPRAKITVPGPPADFVSRPRLRAVLDAAGEAALVFVGAPAGFGKTLLLAEWARHRDGGAVAWLSADTDDNDDRLFWSAVLEALGRCRRIPDGNPLRRLAVPDAPSTDLAFLAQVADALDTLPEPVVLVLDNAQEITSAGPWQGLRALVRHQPASLCLAVASRREPPLPLGRARLADRLVEVGAARLRFTAEEADALLATAGSAIPRDQVAHLVARTGGWPAGLRLAAASAARHGSLRDFCAGRDSSVLGYLTDEVLAALTPAQRELLRTISICDEVPAGLAPELSGRVDAEAMLRELGEPATQVVDSGGTPPRHAVLPVLRTYLRAELQRRAPDRTRTLHAKAARWFAEHDRPGPALLHSVRSGRPERVRELLREHAVTLFLAGEHHVLRLALSLLADRRIAVDPPAALVSAGLCLEAAETSAAALQLARAEAAWPERPTAELTVLRQLTYSWLDRLDHPPAARQAGQVDEELAADAGLGSLATLHRAGVLVARDEREAAREALLQVLGTAERVHQDFTVAQCLTLLAELACHDGDYRAMETLARRAGARLPHQDPPRSLQGAQAGALLAYGALLRGEPADCLKHAKRVGQLLGDAPARAARELRLFAETLRGAAEFELGSWHAGLRRMRRARTRLGTGRACPAGHAALCAVLEQRAALRLGAAGQARETVRWALPILAGSGELLLMRARTQLRLGRHHAATSVLRSLSDDETPMEPAWAAIEVSLLGVQAALAAGAAERAARLLDEALRAAEPTGVRFPFVFAPPELIGFLTSRLGGLGAGERFAGEILAVRQRLRTPPMPAPLTERERSVLRLLPTQRSIDEIAQDLTVSPNTVKTHVRGIYAKLDVRSRREAVATAQERGLLDAEVADFTV
ncbi:LuxR C-terminal-related transcriptional regulator [Amycolatopsis tolypomycina]|uniref:LuxR family transcriptional regulator, maltose regulon positive regulatory protein n=1 Tax=Amycolatopsis tolypomycina TaxID=208445 RepID=A0A1H4SXR0_9PSEU|nr:LuxR C-terminal-related transcriptional regulator [Amycolatopsis tolypomycina]SEC48810.1 LuxR family transcriptional regulator, maltose regulon positive regulatory protein [Amycolatopsis tolypomycina]